MKKTFDFGKIDYNGTGRKNCAVTVEVELRQKEDGREVLSICGNIWNTRHTDIYCGGQCLDTIARYVKTPLFKELYRFWKLYHLNDMHPECEHQAAQGWRKIAAEYVPLYTFQMTADAIRAQRAIKEKVLTAARNGEAYQTTAEEQKTLALDFSIKYHADALPAEIAPFYTLKETERKMCGWLKESEHPQGILSKPCPVCGYQYGHSWNYFSIPADDLNRIKELLTGGENNAA